MLNLLIVEDEYNLRAVLRESLSNNGYNCYTAENGKVAYDLYSNTKIDLVITDVMMPYLDGNSLVKKIRLDDSETPIIMLTALGTYVDKENGYISGADQYIVKPVDLKELNLVVKSLLRRFNKAKESILKIGNSHLNYQTRECVINKKFITLANKEFELLFLLLSSPGQIFTRNHIMDEIWGYDSDAYDRTVDSHIKKVRAKVLSEDFNIVTVRGLGYKGVIIWEV